MSDEVLIAARFNGPVRSGNGGYVCGSLADRVPELAALDAKHVHEPWTAPDGTPKGYPERIVDHQEERAEALARYERIK